MNHKANKLLTTILIAAMILGIAPAILAAPPTPPAFWIIPENSNFETGTTPVGTKFNVTVWISTTEAIFTWQVYVTFNATQLNVVRTDYTGTGLNLGKSQFYAGHLTSPVSPIIDNVTGSLKHGETLIGIDTRPAGTDTLIWIEFQIMSAPAVGQTLTSLIDVNNVDTYMLKSNLDTIAGVGKGHDTYVYAWSTPPKPTLAVSPASLTYGKLSIWNGTTFNEDIVINGMDAGWFLINATTHLIYNDTLLVLDSYTFDPLWNVTSLTNTTGNALIVVSDPLTNPNGNVKIVTLTFRIVGQGSSPPRPSNAFDTSVMDLNNYALYSFYDPPGLILTNPEIDGLVKVYCFEATAPPHLEVSSATMGPGPAVGQEFNITVSLVGDNIDVFKIIGVQFRLSYDNSLIQPVNVTEGPLLPYWASQQPGSIGTFFISFVEDPDGIFGPHVLVGNMIYPDMNGTWHAPMLNSSGVVAIITFKVLYQSFGEPNIISPLNIVQQLGVGLDNLVDQNIVDAPLSDPVNGNYTITTNLPGRGIDLYGGAVNSGLIPLDTQYYRQFVPPYGGQGQRYFNETEQLWHEFPMDMVEPQSWVYLNANVTYNYWPVQHKLVAFEVDMPGQLGMYTNLFAFTDVNGVATIGFRMPWPCDNPESLFGVWHVTATVQLADIVINDTMDFHYDYIVNIFKVTTDKYQYNHGETVHVTITYGTHAQQYYPLLIKTSIADELGVVFGQSVIGTTVGGTVYCQYRNFTVSTDIWIPKWAYAGIGTVHVNAFSCEPRFGGVPIGPEYTPPPTIAVQPYWTL